MDTRGRNGTLVLHGPAELPYLPRRFSVTMARMAKEDRSFLGWFAFTESVMALALAAFGLRSTSASGAPSSGDSAAAPASVEVTVSEFRFSPLMITLPATGGTINISNTGSAVHTFAVPELGITSGDINPGATAHVKVGAVAAKMYDVQCEIAGHAANEIGRASCRE